MTPTTTRAGREDMLRSAASVLTKTGEAFLPAVVQEVARVFDGSVAVVAEIVEGERLQTVALWRNGARLARPSSSRSTGTPCQELLNRAMRERGKERQSALPHRSAPANQPRRSATSRCRSSGSVTKSSAR